MKRNRDGVELNIDLGEMESEPDELYELATTVNVACGGHAGDDRSMRRAIELALRHGASIAAHPSYPDREGFGRRARHSGPVETGAAVEAQCIALRAIALACGAEVRAVKPHGALYHDASDDRTMADAVLDAVARALPALDTVVGPPDGELEKAAAARGLAYLREGFVDRRYDDRMRLLPRSVEGALITDPDACRAQALTLAASGRYETLCAHGDTPGALTIARAARDALRQAGRLVTR